MFSHHGPTQPMMLEICLITACVSSKKEQRDNGRKLCQTEYFASHQETAMKKLVALMGVAVVALFFTSGSLELSAQGKKGSTKQGTIELLESRDGKFRFSVRDSEGKYLGGSAVGHATEKEARESAEELKSVIATAKYVSKKSDSGKDKGKDK